MDGPRSKLLDSGMAQFHTEPAPGPAGAVSEAVCETLPHTGGFSTHSFLFLNMSIFVLLWVNSYSYICTPESELKFLKLTAKSQHTGKTSLHWDLMDHLPLLHNSFLKNLNITVQ